MLYKLLSVSKFSGLTAVNIGDYIQALASSQYYPHIDGFLDRDEDLKNYDGEPCKMIMNGWYMHNPLNWPPSEKINPLYVAFHLNTLAKKELLSPVSIAYLKHHEPIGCRDLYTLDILKSYNVEAYFSACMTLTLGKKFHSTEKRNKVYIVDPQLNSSLSISFVFKGIYDALCHPFDICKLCFAKQLSLHRGRNVIKKFLKTALYYREYTKIFDRKLIVEATYICQEDGRYKKYFNSDEKRLDEAERLVRLYAKAKLVITSRIHCALPCLGIETPVIYLEKVQDIEASSCRMGGLRDLFNILKVDKGVLKPAFEIKLPITTENFPKNKDLWRRYAEDLDRICKKFMNDQNN